MLIILCIWFIVGLLLCGKLKLFKGSQDVWFYIQLLLVIALSPIIIIILSSAILSVFWFDDILWED